MAQAWVQPDRPRLTRSGLFLVATILLFPAVAASVAVAAPKLALLQHRSLPVLAANHLVTLGWGTMVAIGALHALLPAAAGVRQDVPRIVPWQFGIHLWGVLVLGASFWTRHTGGLIASVLISAGTAWWILGRRTRWSWPLTYVTVALGGLVAATSWGALGVLRDPVRWMVAGVSLFLTGWVTVAITGQAYRITPFLMWYYRFALGMPAYDVPRLEAPYWPRSAVAPLSLLAAAGPLISLGVLLRLPWMSGAGGAAYFLGACLFSWLLGYSWLPRLRTIRNGAARPFPPQ